LLFLCVPPRLRGGNSLEGVVANEGDKNLIHIRANSVPNLFSDTDNLQVEGNESQL